MLFEPWYMCVVTSNYPGVVASETYPDAVSGYALHILGDGDLQGVYSILLQSDMSLSCRQ